MGLKRRGPLRVDGCCSTWTIFSAKTLNSNAIIYSCSTYTALSAAHDYYQYI